MIKKSFFIVLGLLLGQNLFSQPGQVIDQVVAVVGNNIILDSDIQNQYLQLLAQGFDYEGDLKCQIFEDLLYQKLLLNQAIIDSVEVTEAEVEQRLDTRLSMIIHQAGSEQELEDYFGKSMTEIKNDLRTMLREQLLTQKMQSQITDDIKITPSEVRSYYKGLPKDSIPLINSEVVLAEIEYKPTISDDEIQAVKDRLNGFLERIKNGDKFSTLAILYSEDPGSAKNGGELGYISRKDLVPEFAAVAFNLKEPGEVSKIVETDYGYHIIQLIDRRGERINIRHILLTPKVPYTEKIRAMNFLDSLAKEIRLGNISFEDAALKYSTNEETRASGGLLVNPATGMAKFETDELDRRMYATIKNLKAGELSDPVESRNEQNKVIYKIVKLNNRTEPHVANLKQDYQYLQDAALENKKQKAIDQWIKLKQKATYIKVKGSYKNCLFKNAGWIKE